MISHLRRYQTWSSPRAAAVAAAIALPLLLAVAGCRPDRQRSSAYVEIPSGSFARGWSADLKLAGREKVAAITPVGDLLIVQTNQNTAFALSASGGTIRWSSQVSSPDRLLGRPVLAGERLVFPAVDRLIVYTVQGQREKEIQLDRAVRSALSPAGEFVYLGFDYAGQGRLGRVSLVQPYVAVRWELLTRGAVSAAPAVFQDAVYAGSEDGNVYAVGEDRSPLWATPGNVFSTSGPIVADVKADDSGVYVASADSRLYALDRLTGKLKWQFFAGRPLRTPPLLTDDTVYQYVPGRGVVALEKLGGAYNREPKWVAESAVRPLAQDGQRAYLQSGDDNVLAVDRKTGKVVFSTRRGDLRVFAGSAAPGGDMVFASTEAGLVMGIKPVTTGGTTGQLVQAPADGGDLAIARR